MPAERLSDLTIAGKDKKRVMIYAAVLLTVSVFLFAAGPRLFLLALIELEYSRTKTPAVYRVPFERKISVPPPAQIPTGTRYYLQEHAFRVSWALTRQFQTPTVRAFVFEGERIVLASIRTESATLLKTLLGEAPEESRKMRELLGPENTASEFGLVDLCLQISPAAAGLSSSVEELKRMRMLLIVKSAFPGGAEIHRIRLGKLQGFQFGEPQNDAAVFVYLYTPRDRLLRLKLTGLTQTEIDRILASMESADYVQSDRGPARAG